MGTELVMLMVFATLSGTFAASLSSSEKLDTMLDLIEDIHRNIVKDVDMNRVRSCDAIKKLHSSATSGRYTIYPGGRGPGVSVKCDMSDENVGWTIIQLRRDGSVEFDKIWNDYKVGFGSVFKNHWLGNDNIHRITADGNNILRIDLGDWSGNYRYALYNDFEVGDEKSKYKLTVTGYSGNAGDSLASHNGQQFSTKDQDNDSDRRINCASSTYGSGGWWYGSCSTANLNGRYNTGSSQKTHYNGVEWYHWHGAKYSLKAVSMKVRPG